MACHSKLGRNLLNDTGKEKQEVVDIDSHSEVMSWSNMGPSFTMIALYDYDPHELSPNIDKKVLLKQNV